MRGISVCENWRRQLCKADTHRGTKGSHERLRHVRRSRAYWIAALCDLHTNSGRSHRAVAAGLMLTIDSAIRAAGREYRVNRGWHSGPTVDNRFPVTSASCGPRNEWQIISIIVHVYASDSAVSLEILVTSKWILSRHTGGFAAASTKTASGSLVAATGI